MIPKCLSFNSYCLLTSHINYKEKASICAFHFSFLPIQRLYKILIYSYFKGKRLILVTKQKNHTC